MWQYKIFNFLPYDFKILVILILFLMIIGTFFEAFGIAMIVPLMTILTDPDRISEFKYSVDIIDYFEINEENLLIYGITAFGLIYFFKTIFLSFQAWIILRFGFRVQAHFARKLITNYLSTVYEYHLSQNSSKLIRNITSESDSFAGIITGLTTLILEIMVCTAIIALLLYFQTEVVLMILALFFVLGSIYFFITKNKIFIWGKQRQYFEGERLKNINQSLGGIKEVIFYNVKKKFISDFDQSNNQTIKAQVKSEILKRLSPYILEFLVLIIFISVFFYFYFSKDNFDTFIPTITLFAVSFFRLLPSINRINNCWQGLRFSKVSADLIIDEVEKTNQLLQHKSFKTSDRNLLKGELCVKNISFKYENTPDLVLNNLSLNIPYGDFVGIVGKTGAGKTTFIDIILGLLNNSSGEISVGNVIINDHEKTVQWQKSLGYASQHIFLCDDTIKSNIAFGLPESEISDARINDCIKISQLSEMIRNLPSGINTKIGERGVRLSGGQRQRIGIARALYHNPNFLILDEATSALDFETENKIIESLIKFKSKKTIIFISHRKNSLKDCDKVYSLSDTKIETII
ncbi:ABC transporter ATP-binding protein/permease [Pelagibacteraceae bacterium]|nr:ABC transporter ATP-binding protein/permease [Pelagibacteraceae bacterium]